MRFLFWVVKVTHGASSRVQGLGERGHVSLASSPCLVLVPPPSLGQRVEGGGVRGAASLIQRKWYKGLAFSLIEPLV